MATITRFAKAPRDWPFSVAPDYGGNRGEVAVMPSSA